MHDPMTQAFSIPNPFLPRYEWGRSWFARPSLGIIWHVDPEKGGSDDSCDWSGRRRRLNKRETALMEAWSELSHTLGNEPFYPHPRLYGREPHAEGNTSPIREMERAYYAWRRQGRIRWHPRWHVHHWSIRIFPVLHFKRWAFSRCTVCGGRFAWGYAPVSDTWYGPGPGWFRNVERVRHGDCSRPTDDRPRAVLSSEPTPGGEASPQTMDRAGWLPAADAGDAHATPALNPEEGK